MSDENLIKNYNENFKKIKKKIVQLSWIFVKVHVPLNINDGASFDPYRIW